MSLSLSYKIHKREHERFQTGRQRQKVEKRVLTSLEGVGRRNNFWRFSEILKRLKHLKQMLA